MGRAESAPDESISSAKEAQRIGDDIKRRPAKLPGSYSAGAKLRFPAPRSSRRTTEAGPGMLISWVAGSQLDAQLLLFTTGLIARILADDFTDFCGRSSSPASLS